MPEKSYQKDNGTNLKELTIAKAEAISGRKKK